MITLVLPKLKLHFTTRLWNTWISSSRWIWFSVHVLKISFVEEQW